MMVSVGVRFTRAFVLLAILIGMAGCRTSSLLLRERSDSTSELIVVGDVRSYMEGRADRSRYWQVPGDVFEVAVGIASTNRETDQQATAVVANGVAYVRPQDAPVDVLAIRHIDDDIQSSFLMGIASGHNPSARYTITAGSRGVSMGQLLAEVARKHGDVVFVVGVGEFVFLEGQSLSMPPDAGEPLYGLNAPRAFVRPGAGLEAPALFAGALLRDDATISGLRARAFFHDPARPRPDGELSRIHALVLSSDSGIMSARSERLRSRALTAIELSPSSRVRTGSIAVYTISSIDARPGE